MKKPRGDIAFLLTADTGVAGTSPHVARSFFQWYSMTNIAIYIIFNRWVQRTTFVSANRRQLSCWQTITAILAASSKDGSQSQPSLQPARKMAANHSHPCSQLGRWQPITAILAASSEDGLLIGQFLVCPAMSQPIRRDKVGAVVRQYIMLPLFLYNPWEGIKYIIVSLFHSPSDIRISIPLLYQLFFITALTQKV